MTSASRRFVVVAAGCLLAACGSGGSVEAPPGPVDPARSTLVAAPSSVVANGSATVVLTATARDAGGVLLRDRRAVFTVAGSGNLLSAATATTSAAGVASVTLASTRAEAKQVSVVIDGVALTQQATATFAAGPAASLALSGVPGSLVAGEAATVAVTASDAFGNLASGYRGTIHLTSSDAQAVLPADVTFGAADAGQRAVQVEWRTSGSQDLTVTDVAAAALTASGSAAVAAAAAARLAFAVQPAAATAGALLAPAVQVVLQDTYGNLASADAVGVSLAIESGPAGATLSGGGATVAQGGAAGFPALWLDRAGSYRLVASAAGLASGSSASFAVGAAAPDGSASGLAAAPASLLVGETSTLTATVRDVYGNPVPGVPVAFAASGTGNTITQPVGVTDAAGVATGGLSSTLTEVKTVTAGAGGATLGQQATVSFAAGPAASLALTGPAGQVTAGTTASVGVTARDAFGNLASGYRGTIRLTSSDARAVLPADVTFGAADAGQRSVLVGPRTAGAQGVTASDVAVPSITGTTTLSVAPAAAVALGFAVQPTGGAAGTSFSPAVRVAVQDAYGNVVTQGTESVVLVLRDGVAGAVLLGGGATATVNGVADYPALSVDKAGAGYRLVASAIGVSAAFSQAFAITAAAPDATASTVSVAQAWVQAGQATTLTATLSDFYGNPATGVAVTFAATGAGNTITQPAAGSGAGGVATGSLLSTRAEAKTVSAVAGGVTLAARPVVSFYAGWPSLPDSTVVAAPAMVVADGTTRSTITVTLQDAYGNPTVNRYAQIGSSRGGLDLLSASYGFSDVHGLVTFTVASSVAGTSTYSVKAEPYMNTLAQTAQVTFVAGPVSATVSSTVPTPPTVPADGVTASTVVVTLRDAQGNPIAGKVVTLASSRGATDLIGPASGPSDAAGQVRFTVTSPTLGVAQLTATDETDGVALSAAPLAFTGPVDGVQSSVVAASWVRADGTTPVLVTVQLRDAVGSPVSGKVVSLASSRGGLDTIAAASGPSDGDGAVSFAVRSSTFGNSTFSAVDTTDGQALLSTAQVAFRSYLAFATPPAAEVPSGAPLAPAPVVAARDAAGHVDAAFTADVTLALGANPVGGALSGTLTVPAVAGAASFPDLRLDKAGGGYTLVASGPPGSKDPVTSGAFAVVAGTPARLVFLVQPSDAGAGPEPLFQVAIHDAAGNPSSATGLAVTVTLATSPAGAILGGTTTAPAFDGVATFAGLGVSAAGSGYTLHASATGLASDTSQPFHVTAPTVVGSGTAASCTEAALDAALAVGGRIIFDCGTAPTTITLTGQKTRAAGAALDGAGLVTLSGGGTTPLFVVNPGVTLALARLTIANGRTGGNGGAITNSGTLALTQVTMAGNSASASNDIWGSPANGGALFNAAGTVLVDRSIFSANAVTSWSCTRGTSANGGAIFSSGGTLLVVNSTFAGNSASAWDAFYGTAGNGGAIFNSGSRLWIVSSTLAANAVSSSSNFYGTGGQGGAIFGGGTLASTILAHGTSGANCAGAFTSRGHDLDSDGSCGVGPATAPGLDPAGAGDHGGPTPTVALLPGSAAIDAGDGARCAAPPVLSVDQRGYARPGPGAAACSVGAFEYGSTGPP
jgi:hypothetical protein